MKINQTTSTGHLKISEEVIGAIVKQTVMEMEGVAGLALVPVSKKDYLLKAKKPKQIMIETNADSVKITLGILMEKGYVIKRTAENVQQQVKEAVQNMAGVAVYQVNIYIAGILQD